jgi:hypothetical protein
MELDGDTKRQARSIEGNFVRVGIDGPGVYPMNAGNDSNRNGVGVKQDSPMRSGHSNVVRPKRNGCDEGVMIGRKEQNRSKAVAKGQGCRREGESREQEEHRSDEKSPAA